MKNVNLGKHGIDRVTGFEGLVIGFVEYLTGCNQYLLAPSCKKGETSKRPDAEWFDDSRIDFKESKIKPLKETGNNGPDRMAAVK